MRRFVEVVLAIGFAAFPLLVLAGFERFGVIGLLLPAAAALRWVLLPRDTRAAGSGTVVVALASFAALFAWTREERLMLTLPVLVSAAAGGTFLASLWGPESLVERLARRSRGVATLPPTVCVYCRQVTVLWAGVLLGNATVIGALALVGHVKAWALYTGAVSYLIMATVMGGEYLYRRLRVIPAADREARELGTVEEVVG